MRYNFTDPDQSPSPFPITLHRFVADTGRFDAGECYALTAKFI